MKEILHQNSGCFDFYSVPCIGQRCQVTPYVVKVVVLVIGGGAIAKMCYNLT